MFGDAPSAAAYERPLLVILDRNLDLPVMLHHTWTYQALTHDLLALSLNRVVVPGTKDETTGKTSAPKTYDLNHSDDFWTQNAGQPFPKVAEAVERTLEEYQNEVAEINKSAGSIGDLVGDASLRENLAEKSFGSDTEALAKALEKVPALMKKKRLIDIHTNIATALLDQIKDRGLDGFFQLEDQVLSGAASSIAQNALLSMIRGNAGRPMDKLRMFLIYFLCHPELPSSEITEFRLALEESGCDIRALDYVRGIKALTATLTTAPPTGGEASSKVHASGLEKMMSTVVEHGVKGLAQVATNFNKLILEEDKMLAVARVVNTLMDQKGSSDILERYIYLDPRKPSSDRSRANRTFRQAVVFMVGGGNYLEYQNVREHARGGKHVIYGATDICSAEDFAKQLAGLSGVPAPPTVTPTKGNGGAL
uniref:Sec1 family domain-containing protein 1 n=1 Tax=Compsopogon caeruleus TaxID=31354 RepID=A0A7S1XDM7_9RHOD